MASRLPFLTQTAGSAWRRAAMRGLPRSAKAALRTPSFASESTQLWASAHSGARKPKGSTAGFSYPGPRSLDKIVKVQLLNRHGTPRVREIWGEYHKDHKTAVGDSITAEEHGLLMQRTKRCGVFVLPVPRESGYFTLVLQFQDKYCLCTYLEDFKKNPGQAMPYLTFTFFDDMLVKKRVALVRGEVTNHLTVGEARKIWELIKHYYLGPRHLYEDVIAFNEKSEKFDFQKVLGVAQVST